jgi:hypothetical protein
MSNVLVSAVRTPNGLCGRLLDPVTPFLTPRCGRVTLVRADAEADQHRLRRRLGCQRASRASVRGEAGW